MTIEESEITIKALLSGWEGALHSADSMFQVIQSVPDWQKKLDEATQDKFRRQATTDRFAPIIQAVRKMLEGASGIEPLKQALATIKKTH